jgi:hypothetical protein
LIITKYSKFACLFSNGRFSTTTLQNNSWKIENHRWALS